MNNRIGGVVDQYKLIVEFQENHGITAKRAAEIMDTSYNTLKEWKGGRRAMLKPALKLINVLNDLKGTKIGKKYGV